MISTNLACYFAQHNFQTSLMDIDPGGSALNWLKLRSPANKSIDGISASKKDTWQEVLQMKIPSMTERLIIDAPAGTDNQVLQDIVKLANVIVIPVEPSATDIHAAADFIKDLFLLGKLRIDRTSVAVVANRVRHGTTVYNPLKKFLRSLNLQFVTFIADSEYYLHALSEGFGVFEMDQLNFMLEQAEFQPLINWLDKVQEKQKRGSATEKSAVPEMTTRIIYKSG